MFNMQKLIADLKEGKSVTDIKLISASLHTQTLTRR